MNRSGATEVVSKTSCARAAEAVKSKAKQAARTPVAHPNGFAFSFRIASPGDFDGFLYVARTRPKLHFQRTQGCATLCKRFRAIDPRPGFRVVDSQEQGLTTVRHACQRQRQRIG